MDEQSTNYANNTVDSKDIYGYKSRDKFFIKNDRLYQLSSEKWFNEHQNNADDFLIVRVSDSQRLYYEIVSAGSQQTVIQLEQYKINEKIAQAQIEKISSINGKLTFFVVLTIINIVASIILALK